jgi:Galactose oxidase, central domain
MKRYLLLLIPICSLCLLNACGGSSAPPVVPPSITTTEAQVMAVPAIVGTPYSFIFGASFSQPGPYSWQAVGLPTNGLSFDPSSATVSGIPTAKASVAFSLTATDGAGHSSTAVSFMIPVTNPPPPTITTTQAQVTAAPVLIENSYSFSFAASGGLAPLSWSETGNLPATLALSTGGVLSGTTATSGSFPIAVIVQDALGQKTAPQNFTITVTNPPPPTINTTPPPTVGVENHAYSFTFTATAGYPPLAWTETGTLPAGLAFSTAGVISGTPSVIGSFPIAVSAQDTHGETAGPQNFTIQVLLGFNATGSMETPRYYHTATLLNTGKVLVAGGQSGGAVLATAELYDPATGTFSPTTNLQTARAEHVAILLSDGGVLMVGGKDANGTVLATTELYDPAKGTSDSTGSMKEPRYGFTATLLPDGRVLVAGGIDASGNALESAELFDPTTRTFSLTTGVMISPRSLHTATLLNTGKVLVAGGHVPSGDLDTAELFDPSSQSFTPTTANMKVKRSDFTATLLKDGRVLLAGPYPSAEIFDPSTGTFTATGNLPGTVATTRVVGSTATLRTDGTVIIAGGQYSVVCEPIAPGGSPRWSTVASADLFDPGTGTFSGTGSMSFSRSRHTATLLTNGSVLVTGGIEYTLRANPCVIGGSVESVTPSAELFP